MNNTKLATLIGWQTRRRKIYNLPMQWCQNYGLHAFAHNLYIGYLNQKERKEIEEHFKKALIKQTDRFFIFPLCATCYNNSEIIKFDKNQCQLPDFEII